MEKLKEEKNSPIQSQKIINGIGDALKS